MSASIRESFPRVLKAPKRIPWYFITLLTFFVIPVLWLRMVWKKIDQKAFIFALGIIILLGYAWSMLVSANEWWIFNADNMLGINILPHLPLEEAMFYPLGGALSILLYAYFELKLKPPKVRGNFLLVLLLTGTLASLILIGLSILLKKLQPYYVISQLVLFNGLCFVLWPKTHHRICIGPVILATIVMTGIGFFWDWLAFTLGWWSYHAILGWMWPPQVPIDDWNFFLFAPLAAISWYVLFRVPKEIP